MENSIEYQQLRQGFDTGANKQIRKDLEEFQTRNFRLPSMCDRILFALQTNQVKFDTETGIVVKDDILRKSKHRLIYAKFIL